MATRRNRFQFQALFSDTFTAKESVTVASTATGAGSSNTVTVPGVALGDMVLGLSISASTAGVIVKADVTAANTVTIRFQNDSGSTFNPGTVTAHILVGRPSPANFV